MKIVGIMVAEECDRCSGSGRVPGGQREYGEIVGCMICSGRGYTVERAGFDEVVDAIGNFLAYHGSITQRVYQKIRMHLGGR
ncbi:MAG: hypothetical protein PVSMB8_00090 [Vulcanimicrobiaceae bacterium]